MSQATSSASEALYYRHSGKAPVGGLGLGLAGGLVVGIPAAIAYAYGILYIPIAGYVTFIIVAAFGGAVGLAAGTALSFGKVRNPALYYGVALVAGLLAYYVSWAVWTYAVFRRGGVEASFGMFFAPGALWEGVNFINTHGAWSIKSWTPTGGVLWLFWAIEAGIFFVLTGMLAIASLGLFCEDCGDWCDEGKGVTRFGVGNGMFSSDDRDRLKANMEQRDYSFFESLGAPQGDHRVLRVDACTCGCNKLNAVSISDIIMGTNKDGEPEEDETVVFTQLLVSPEQLAALVALGEKAAASPAEVVVVEDGESAA